MSDEWSDVALADVTLQIKRGRAPSYCESGGALVLNQKCIRSSNALDLSVARRTDADAKSVPDFAWVKPGDVLVCSTGRGTLGRASHVAALSEPTTVDSHVTIVRPKAEAVLGEYLGLNLSMRQAELEDLQSGSTNQTELSTGALSGLRVSIPPLAVQRRIVDLMAHLDNHYTDLRAERDALHRLLSTTLASWDHQLTGAPKVSLGSLCAPRSGPSWAAADESKEMAEGSLRVVKITNTRPDGTLDMTDRTYVAGLPSSVSTLGDRSLILIRTNGNRERIGNVYRPTPEAFGCAVSAFQFAADLASVEERDWLFWWLKSPRQQRAMSDAASGTTGLGNLAAGWLKALEVPWPDEEARATLIAVADAISTQGASISAELAEVERLRSALLQQLLGGEVEIPDSYDSLLAEVA